MESKIAPQIQSISIFNSSCKLQQCHESCILVTIPNCLILKTHTTNNDDPFSISICSLVTLLHGKVASLLVIMHINKIFCHKTILHIATLYYDICCCIEYSILARYYMQKNWNICWIRLHGFNPQSIVVINMSDNALACLHTCHHYNYLQ